MCHSFLDRLKSLSGPTIQTAAKLLDATQRKVELVAADDKRLDPGGANSDGNPNTYTFGNTTISSIYINSKVGEATQLTAVAHEALYHNQNTLGLPTDIGHVDNRARDVPLVQELQSQGIVAKGYIRGLIQDKVPGAEQLKPFNQ